MPLHIIPATPADAARIVTIERAAYAPNPFNNYLFPGPFPDDVEQRRAAELVEQLEADPTTRWLKVVDDEISDPSGTGSGESMIAFANWHIYNPREAPKETGATKSRAVPQGVNLEACGALFGDLARMHAQLMGVGKKYVFLQTLLTDPKHQGRGAGGMLIQWGLDEAAELGLPAYLESSLAAHNLYLKFGFRDIQEHTLDFSKWGLNKVHQTWAMIKDPAPGSAS